MLDNAYGNKQGNKAMAYTAKEIEVFQTQAEDLLKVALRASEDGRPETAIHRIQEARKLMEKVARAQR